MSVTLQSSDSMIDILKGLNYRTSTRHLKSYGLKTMFTFIKKTTENVSQQHKRWITVFYVYFSQKREFLFQVQSFYLPGTIIKIVFTHFTGGIFDIKEIQST